MLDLEALAYIILPSNQVSDQGDKGDRFEDRLESSSAKGKAPAWSRVSLRVDLDSQLKSGVVATHFSWIW
ncbi:hypothetical protein L1987_59708 [Smallanthus sonchifolius]|uniref:Uncharacterized protein n=1 Tax=Smallanthus sonchifolius TaxID=185202 RepID=A0ACB9D600_9ASTR|nr:hypothetical protein L1987_59708 [Smallanthus sonchifolius]